jgi:hypothetical protein
MRDGFGFVVRLHSVLLTPKFFHSFVFKNYEEMKNHFKTHTGMGEMFAHSVKVQTVDWNYDGRKLPSDSFDKTAFIFTRESDTLVSSL